ncbi:hypothetical protein MKZ38_008200 [Zalerion maritima]|uniref:Uncharacterized protein n=1 Tax=Zalerion maritima TaxID=339359 RepID=A0AAD5WNR9_9PEZI|nr:hypothetical protein MKZ38_008200 [Zalerion maritima]
MGFVSTIARKLVAKSGITWFPGKKHEGGDGLPPGCINPTGNSHSYAEQFDPARVRQCQDRNPPATGAETGLPRGPCGCINKCSKHIHQPHYPRRGRGCCVNTPVLPQGDGESGASSCSSSESGEKNYRTLTPEEYKAVLRGVGAHDPQDPSKPAHPTNRAYPPKGMPRGLYRDILEQKTKYTYLYYGVTTLQWVGVITQIVLGTILAYRTSSIFTGSGKDNSGEGIFSTDKYPIPQKEGQPPVQPSDNPSRTSTGTYAKLGGLVIANMINVTLVTVLRGMGFIPRYSKFKNVFGGVENDIRRVIDTQVVDEDLEDPNEVVYQLYGQYNRAYCKVSKTPPPVPVHPPEKNE